MDRIANGSIVSDSQQVLRLKHQLSDTERQLLLSRQLIQELEKIHEIQNQIKDVSTRLIFDREDIDNSDEETGKLYDLKNKLKTHEEKLKKLKKFDNGGPQLDVKLMSYKKISGNKYRVGGKEVSITRSIGERDTSVESDAETTEYVPTRNRNWSGTTENSIKTGNSRYSGRTESIEDELRSLNGRKSGRRSVIPQRFESFPYGSLKKGHLVTGLIGFIVFVVLAIICSILIQTNDRQELDLFASNAKRYLIQTYDRAMAAVTTAVGSAAEYMSASD